MVRSRILAHSRADGRPLRLADDSSVLFSSTDWPDLKVERQVLPPTSMGERYLPDHLITVHLRPPSELTSRGESGLTRWHPERGDVFVLPAWTVSSPAWPDEIEGVHVALSPAYVDRLAEEVLGGPAGFGAECVGPDPQLRHLAFALAAEAAGGDGADLLLVESLTTALGLRLLRGYARPRRPGEPPRPGRPRRGSAMVARVRARIEDTIDQHVTIADLAADEHLSPFHFAHLFKSAAGVTPYRFVTECRVERARGLLGATDLTVGEIARRCGFANPAQLARAFRRVLGESPTGYRRRL